jgi:glycosyltransferase involved in cell wall biosynthesis
MDWSLSATVADLHKKSRFDLIDAEFGFPDGPVAHRLSRRFGIPFSVTLRGSEVEHAAIPARRRALSEAFQSAAAVVALSGRLKDFAISLGARAARTHVIPNGIDSSLYHPRDRAALRAQLHFDEDAFHVLTAGHLIELKGHHLAVEAVARSAPNVRLCVAGGPGSRASFEPRIRELIDALGLRDRVTLAGHLPPARLAEYMCASDLYCLASSREGWPNTVQESLACGTPVAAFDVGAIPEMLPFEDLGCIVPARTPEALAAAFAHCRSREWDRARIAAWGARRSWSAVGDEVVAILQAALKDSPSPV